jgi:hypothetical protein
MHSRLKVHFQCLSLQFILFFVWPSAKWLVCIISLHNFHAWRATHHGHCGPTDQVACRPFCFLPAFLLHHRLFKLRKRCNTRRSEPPTQRFAAASHWQPPISNRWSLVTRSCTAPHGRVADLARSLEPPSYTWNFARCACPPNVVALSLEAARDRDHHGHTISTLQLGRGPQGAGPGEAYGPRQLCWASGGGVCIQMWKTNIEVFSRWCPLSRLPHQMFRIIVGNPERELHSYLSYSERSLGIHH